MTLAESEAAPGASGGAQGGVYAIDGNSSFDFQGTTYAVSLPGTALQGMTKLVQVGAHVERAYVYLPTTPTGNTPRGQRPVGEPVRSAIAFHELVHVCGLSNDDHDGAAFHGHPQFEPGTRPPQDRVAIGTGRNRLIVPPLAISRETCRRIRANWADS